MIKSWIAVWALVSASSPIAGLMMCDQTLYEYETGGEWCGQVELPRDHLSNDGETFSLPIVYVASPNPAARSRPPVVFLNGGPGQSNLDRLPIRRLLEEFDVVQIGYRGIDSDISVQCETIQKAITQSKRLMQDGQINLISAIDECATSYSAKDWPPRLISVDQTVHDISATLDYLDIQQYHIAAGSFGTRIALHLQEVASERVYRTVLLGANPPGYTIWRPDDLHLVWLRALDEVGETPRENEFPFANLDRESAQFAGVKFDDDRARITAFLLSYDASMIPLIVDTFLDTQEGNNLGRLALSIAHDPALENAGIHWPHFIFMAASADLDRSHNYDDALSPSAQAPFGSPLAHFMWPAIAESTLEASDVETQQLSTIDSETLIISGTLDLSAPVEVINRELLPIRPNSWHWQIQNAGHSNLYTKEVMTEASQFLLSGRHPKSMIHIPIDNRPRIGISEFVILTAAAVFLFSTLLLVLFARRGRR